MTEDRLPRSTGVDLADPDEGRDVRIALVGGHGDRAGTHDAPAGGRAVYLRELHASLSATGHDVTLHAADAEHPSHTAFTARLQRGFARHVPDVVHSNGWQAGAAVLEATAGAIPIVHSFHGLGTVARRHGGSGPAAPPERLEIERVVARHAGLVLASCVDEQREVLALGTPRHRVEIVPEGVDVTRFRRGRGNRRGGRPRVLALGRPVPHQGIDVAVQAMRHLPDAELLVVGDTRDPAADPGIARLVDLARRNLVEDRVSFRGAVPYHEVPHLLRSVDVLVATPWYEGFGRVCVEAMACGVPVVAASVGGMLDTVQHGRTGLIVPARDPRATAGALRYLLREPVLRRRMGTSASAWVHDNYAWPRIAEELAGHYRRMASQETLMAATS